MAQATLCTVLVTLLALGCAAAQTSVASADADAVPDLLFRDFYAMPVGSRGLQPSEKLLALHGETVRMRGYMARQEPAMSGAFILSPLPVELGDADESLSDDLPPAVVFVHYDAQQLPYTPGVLQLTGTLSVGAKNEADGHVSQVRLNLDPAQLAAVTQLTSRTTAASPRPNNP